MKKFALLIYTDDSLLDALPEGDFDDKMRHCLAYADGLSEAGQLHHSEMLEGADRARTMRVRGGKRSVMDGPFAETKELLAGFNIIEAEDMDAAVRLAADFPWAATGSIEIREVRSIQSVRDRVHAPTAVSAS